MRLVRFNLVGVLGMAVQLGLLSVLTQVMNSISATVLAVAAAVVHNFAWHWFWTWPDARHRERTMTGHFVRFALANGLVSLAGNSVAMLVLVGSGALRPVPANLVAIGMCGLLNYWASGRLVFASGKPSLDRPK
jgi:putative flippase GtrA